MTDYSTYNLGKINLLSGFTVSVFFLLMFANMQSFGQSEINSTFYRVLSSNNYNQEKFKEDKEYADRWISNETVVIAGRQSQKIEPNGFTLSIVFHALYTDDKAKVEQDVALQLDALNRDFGSVHPVNNTDKHPSNIHATLATAPNIKFELHQSGQSKFESPGISIIKESNDRLQGFDGLKKELIKTAKAITPNKVINVWVVKSDDDIGSFAQMPGGPSDVDGIVIDHRVFGVGTAPFDQGKTLTHLVGNYLGLIDLWGIYPCQDDGVTDTPVHNTPNFNFPNTTHMSTCPGQREEMTINFMDAMADKEMWMFTEGQVKRMHYMLGKNGPRNLLAK